MTEVHVTEPEEPGPEQDSAHQAAVAEGAAAVHHDAAEEAAEEAKQAAEAGLAGAQATIAAAESAAESAARAEAAQEASGVTLEAVHEAVTGLGSGINTLLDEFRASRKESAPKPPEPVTETKDEAPANPRKPKRRGMFRYGS